MYDPVTIKVKAATLTIDTVEQYYVEVTDRDKQEKLVEVVKAERPEQAIIFVRTKIGADRLARRLNDAGVRVKALHGDMSQGQRDGVMIAFKGERERLLVATDVAARGLDISGVTHVINYDVPNSPDIYVHRIGRTGRVGRSGRAITFITPKQRSDLEAIERHAKTEIGPWGAQARLTKSERTSKPQAEESAAEPEREASESAAQEPATTERPARDRKPRERKPREPARTSEPREARRPRHTKPRREPHGTAREADDRRRPEAGPRACRRDRRDRRPLSPRGRGHHQRAPARPVQLRRGPGRRVRKRLSTTVSGKTVRGVTLKLEVAKR